MLISVLNTKGGVGKSTLAVHLTGWLHGQGLRVAAIDADRQRSLTEWLAAAAPDLRVFDLSTAGGILEEAPRIAGGHDVVVADGPAALGAEIGALAACSDVVLLPIGASMLDIWASYRAARLIYKIKFSPKRARELAAFAVLNRAYTGDPTMEVAHAAAQRFGFPTARTMIAANPAFLHAVQRKTFVWSVPGPLAQRATMDIRALLAEVMGIRAAGVSLEDRLTAPRMRTAQADAV